MKWEGEKGGHEETLFSFLFFWLGFDLDLYSKIRSFFHNVFYLFISTFFFFLGG